jgi:hypothetical protein
MTQEFQPTPAEQNLLNFLDKLATTPYSPELMQEGNQLLDAAVEENRRLLTPSTPCSKAMTTTKQVAELEKEME